MNRTSHRRNRPRRRQRYGFVLIIVLVTVVILSLSAYTFTALMQTEEQAARLMTRRVQSKYLVDSGVDYAQQFLLRDEASIREKGGRWDNSDQFQGIPVAASVGDVQNIGAFTVVASNLDDDGNPDGFRFGLTDESTKINLNVLPFRDNDPTAPQNGRNILMALPDMTEEIRDAILDWLDADDDALDFGAEGSYYRSQSPPYEPKNGPLDSLDELLLIRGVTPELLFGLDTNRNGVLDDAEADAGNVSSADANMHLGWANYLTLYSSESNLNLDGLPRININDDDLEQLYDDLKSRFDDNWANFIIYWRTMASDVTPPAATPFQQPNALPVNFATAISRRKFRNVLDLAGAYAETTDPTGAIVYMRSPLASGSDPADPKLLSFGFDLNAAMNELTHFAGPSIPGRINIMQAPRIVLNSIPRITENQIDLIIDRREYELDDPDGVDLLRKHPTWLYAEGGPALRIVTNLLDMQNMLEYVCTGGDVYRAEIVGFFPDGVGTSRAEAVIDTIAGQSRRLFWRDKSHLQSGYSIDLLGSRLER